MSGINTPELETERLILRKFTENDLPALLAIFSDEEANTFLPWFPLKSMREAKSFFVKRCADLYRQERAYQYAICLKSDRIPIGYVNVSMEEHHDLGCGLRKAFWHRGIVTATHDRNNPRSGGVMIQLGMRYQYSYEERWQPKNKLVTFRMYQINLDGNQDRVYGEYWDHSDVHYIETDLVSPDGRG